MDILLTIFMMVFNVLGGAYSLWMAIHQYNDKHYFRFGLYVMCFVTYTIFLAKWIFTV